MKKIIDVRSFDYKCLHDQSSYTSQNCLLNMISTKHVVIIHFNKHSNYKFETK